MFDPVKAVLSTVLSLSLMQSGCSTHTRMPADFGYLIVENSSSDVILLSLDLGDRELKMGRVAPMTRARLRIRKGALPPGSRRGRIRVSAIGAPEAVRVPGRANPLAPHSDWYPIDDLISEVWLYSGSQLMRIRLN